MAYISSDSHHSSRQGTDTTGHMASVIVHQSRESHSSRQGTDRTGHMASIIRTEQNGIQLAFSTCMQSMILPKEWRHTQRVCLPTVRAIMIISLKDAYKAHHPGNSRFLSNR